MVNKDKLVNREGMKTYTSAAQIEKDIDSALKKIAKAKAIAQEHLDAEALLIGASDLTEIREHREAADKQFRKIKRLETVRLPKLKAKLQEFNTIPLAGMEAVHPNPAPQHISPES